MVPEEKTTMGFGEIVYSKTNSAGNSVQLNVTVEMLKCSGTI
jgi:hypothetical protein